MRFPGAGGRTLTITGTAAGERKRKMPEANAAGRLLKSGTGRSLILAFVAILGVFGVVLMKGSGHIRAPVQVQREELAQREVNNLRAALELFRGDVGRYPTEAEGLLALINRPSGLTNWTWNYVKLVRPDPWRNPYVYAFETGRVAKVFSKGADGLPATPDDIVPSGWEPSFQQAVAGRAAVVLAEASAETNGAAGR